MDIAQIKAARRITSSFLASLIGYLAVVVVLYSRAGGFHGFTPDMPKEMILALRTALAALSIFTFFPLIWVIHRRSQPDDLSRWFFWTILALVLADSPSIYGLVLFLVKGAFKTFFAFFALSAFYLTIAWPRQR